MVTSELGVCAESTAKVVAANVFAIGMGALTWLFIDAIIEVNEDTEGGVPLHSLVLLLLLPLLLILMLLLLLVLLLLLWLLMLRLLPLIGLLAVSHKFILFFLGVLFLYSIFVFTG